jgi:oxepin-CoA hydrolase/3-oxo-5,6-dehydrosuberyl-CoA semialdehyde dehydrogenase
VDGGLGVLGTYASHGRKFLPDSNVAIDGEPIPLSRDGSFVGLHVRTPKEGVAVHINAFNFPCWGALEKLAPAMVAGVPVIVKPATPTAYVAEALFQHVVASGIFPEGAIQFLAGSIGDLFDHLDGRDVVGFTGSATTAGWTCWSASAVTARSCGVPASWRSITPPSSA